MEDKILNIELRDFEIIETEFDNKNKTVVMKVLCKYEPTFMKIQPEIKED